jgi:hypothetical protein
MNTLIVLLSVVHAVAQVEATFPLPGSQDHPTS